MYTQKVLDIATNEELLRGANEELDNYISQYPQVSLFQSLKAKMFQLNNDPNYQLQLKKAAIYSPDRKRLYHFLIQPELNKKIEKIEQELDLEVKENLEVIVEEVSTNTQVETTLSEDPIQEVGKKKTESSPSPLEKYSKEKPSKINNEESARQQLEREILQHAVSSSILLDAELVIDDTDQEVKNQNIHVEPSISTDEFNGQNVLDWLKSNEKEETNKLPIKGADELINKFIKKEPQQISSVERKKTFIEISRPKHEFFSPDNMAKMSLMEDENLVTETLAKIYADQGNFKKAAKAYDKLSLKFPEKSDYFARLKKELDN